MLFLWNTPIPPIKQYPYITLSLKNTTDAIIPRKIYQSWCSHDLPPLMKKCNDKLKESNPEFQYELFDDTECREFIRTNFAPDVLNAYDRLIPGAFKADLWRYCILYIYGGIYLDIKYGCVGDFRLVDLLDESKYPSMIVVETGPKYVYTGLLATPKGNPLYKECIDRIVQHVAEGYYGESPMAPTGPELFGGLIPEMEKRRGVLFYYDDYFLKKGEEETREKYRKRGYIKDLRTDKNILSHYLEYRVEQQTHAKTGYWMNLWREGNIYRSSVCDV
jgi:mannosyltransferase OCH1-like enzyme